MFLEKSQEEKMNISHCSRFLPYGYLITSISKNTTQISKYIQANLDGGNQSKTTHGVDLVPK